MKNFLKNNKFIIVAIAIFLVIVLLLVQVKNIFFPQRANALYGDRLKGIEEVKITEKDQGKIKSTLESDGGIKTATVRTSGKTLEVIITVNDDVSLDTAKPYVNKILEACSDEQKSYYDMQVIVKSDSEESEVYPIIGAKHKTSTSFIWDNRSTKKEK